MLLSRVVLKKSKRFRTEFAIGSPYGGTGFFLCLGKGSDEGPKEQRDFTNGITIEAY